MSKQIYLPSGILLLEEDDIVKVINKSARKAF